MSDPVPRSPLSVGLSWASRITSLGIELALPVLAGHFADQRWGTKPGGILIGMVLGFTVGILHLLRIARDSSRPA